MSSSDVSSAEAIASLLGICFPDAQTIYDPTFGSGKFWTDTYPTLTSDGRLDRAADLCADFCALPFSDHCFDVVVFDPPFQPATTDGLIGARFTKPVKGVTGLRSLVESGAREALRVSRLGVVIKVQDYIHDHKPVWMSFWLYEALGEPYEFMTVRSRSKLKAVNWGKQKSVYRNHSTYWVWRTAPKVR